LSRRAHPPLDEEYSRVANPERFAGFVSHAVLRCAELSEQFAVAAEPAFPALPWLPRVAFARPPIQLTPKDPNAAPLAFAFTTFPGVYVRAGYWYLDPFPVCGCDACADTAETEIARLDRLIHAVTSGEFSEELETSWFGDAWLSHRMGSAGAAGRQRIGRRQAKLASKALPRVRDWRPWTRVSPKRIAEVNGRGDR
jgi:hypothetical protein